MVQIIFSYTWDFKLWCVLFYRRKYILSKHQATVGEVDIKDSCFNTNYFWGIQSSNHLLDTIYHSIYKGERAWITFTGFIQPHCCACPKPEARFPMLYVVVFYMFNDLKINLFSPWYGWKIAKLYSNYSLTRSIMCMKFVSVEIMADRLIYYSY